jgi:GT2 family glycosyltransferase
MLVRANLFEKMGGFDEDFFAHMEEIDLCWKLQRAGHRIYYHGESRIYHVGGGTLSKLNPRKTYLNFRNNLSLIFKHMRSGELIWKLPLRFLLDGIAAMRFLFVGQPWHSWAVAKAQVHFIADLPNCYQKRRALRVLGMNESNQVYSGLIIWDYFLRNKKDFKDLKF